MTLQPLPHFIHACNSATPTRHVPCAQVQMVFQSVHGNQTRENTFLEELTAAEGEAEDASQEMDDDEFDDSPVIPKLKTSKEFIASL